MRYGSGLDFRAHLLPEFHPDLRIFEMAFFAELAPIANQIERREVRERGKAVHEPLAGSPDLTKPDEHIENLSNFVTFNCASS
jgi:hypothetical protein